MGVKSYKGEGFEFQLTDEAPVKQTSKSQAHHVQTETIESDILTPEQLMWWSAGDGPIPAPGEQ